MQSLARLHACLVETVQSVPHAAAAAVRPRCHERPGQGAAEWVQGSDPHRLTVKALPVCARAVLGHAIQRTACRIFLRRPPLPCHLSPPPLRSLHNPLAGRGKYVNHLVLGSNLATQHVVLALKLSDLRRCSAIWCGKEQWRGGARVAGGEDVQRKCTSPHSHFVGAT